MNWHKKLYIWHTKFWKHFSSCYYQQIDFRNFCNLLCNAGSYFNTICLMEKWCSNSWIINSSCFDINNYKAILFERKTNRRGGSILIYIKADLMYKIEKGLSIFDKEKELITTGIITKESKNTLLSCFYRSPKIVTENLTAYLTSILQTVQIFREYKFPGFDITKIKLF